jgi:hypothetical protein
VDAATSALVELAVSLEKPCSGRPGLLPQLQAAGSAEALAAAVAAHPATGPCLASTVVSQLTGGGFGALPFGLSSGGGSVELLSEACAKPVVYNERGDAFRLSEAGVTVALQLRFPDLFPPTYLTAQGQPGVLEWLRRALAPHMRDAAKRTIVAPLLVAAHAPMAYLTLLRWEALGCGREGCARRTPPLPAGTQLSRCGKCLLIRYCSRECQRADWDGAGGGADAGAGAGCGVHKRECGALSLGVQLAAGSMLVRSLQAAVPETSRTMDAPTLRGILRAVASSGQLQTAPGWQPALEARLRPFAARP